MRYVGFIWACGLSPQVSTQATGPAEARAQLGGQLCQEPCPRRAGTHFVTLLRGAQGLWLGLWQQQWQEG